MEGWFLPFRLLFGSAPSTSNNTPCSMPWEKKTNKEHLHPVFLLTLCCFFFSWDLPLVNKGSQTWTPTYGPSLQYALHFCGLVGCWQKVQAKSDQTSVVSLVESLTLYNYILCFPSSPTAANVALQEPKQRHEKCIVTALVSVFTITS